MTLAAPRSRQGKFLLVLAVIAALVAVAGTMVWANSARADLPLTITELNQAPDGGGSVTQGDTVTYVGTVTLTAPLQGTDELTIELDVDSDLMVTHTFPSPDVVCAPAASTSGYDIDQWCNWDDPVAAATYSITVTGIATGGPISAPSVQLVCADTDSDNLCVDQSGNDVVTFADINPADVGPLTVNPAVTVDDATNFTGQPHTFAFALAAGVTCQSDPGTGGLNLVECTGADVTIGGTAGCTLTSGPTVLASSLGTPTTVEVTIDGGTGFAGFCTVGLDTTFVGPIEGNVNGADADDFDIAIVTATKTLVTPAGEIRHRDEADLASEDAAGTTDVDPIEDWCFGAPIEYDCGILTPQDDADDATGSFHQACIINTFLTFTADSGDITWNIVPVAGSPLPTPVSITELSGSPDLDEPCVRWSTGFTGTQNITAVYDNGFGQPVTYYWDGYCEAGSACQAVEDLDTPGTDVVVPLPLVKEWNDIDETKIVAVTGVVGYDVDGSDLAANTLGLDDWVNRDCSFVPLNPAGGGYCDDPDLDGLTLEQEAAYIINSPQGILISATSRSFIDYTFGNHSDVGGAYDGPVDGAQQTYTISGDCGSVRLENPQTGETIILSNSLGVGTYLTPAQVNNSYAAAEILSSDKGVGFTFLPTFDGSTAVTLANADCGPNAEICIDISTQEDNLFRSPPIDGAAPESVCVIYTVGPPTSKTPQLAWAGQRVVVEHFWGSIDAAGDLVCPWGDGESFYVLYSVQAGPGSFTAALNNNGFTDVDQTGQNVIVQVFNQPVEDQDGDVQANSGCISRVIFENQDQAQNDIIAYVVEGDFFLDGLAETQVGGPAFGPDLSNATPVSQQVAFVIYYMKFEDVQLSLVPGNRAAHNDGNFTPATSPVSDSSNDVTEMTKNVSADVLARVRVRGWVETTNCPARDSGVGANGEFLPANRCIFPDDWRFKAGGGVGDSLNDPATAAGFAETSRPNFDIWGDTTTACDTDPRASGPFSWLDRNPHGDTTLSVCGDSLAPNVVAGNVCAYAIGYSCRETVFPNGVINAWDAPMPPALARLELSGSGFIRPADKDSIYLTKGNLFYTTHIPAEPWIAPINADLSGYQWNSWGGPGGKAGQYEFWTSLADNGPEVLSCAGKSSGKTVALPPADPCGDGSGVATGGYNMIKIYTDNHGEAMAWINGDANLAFTECDSSAGTAGNDIVLLSGWYCEAGEKVGSSTLNASVDYPDKRKHFAIQSDPVTIDWTWGGVKEVTIVPGENSQFNYVVFHVTDRDGYCNAFNNTPGTMNTLHSVLGEDVSFVIDSSAGIIFPDINGNPAALLGTWTPKTADVTTFQASDTDTDVFSDPLGNDGISVLPLVQSNPDECQAWIHISESLLGTVNVIITAYDPEGTVTFDKIINAPTPVPTPEPTPATQQNLWADIDCNNSVNPVDSLKVLRHDAGLSVSQDANCPAPGTNLDVTWDSSATNEDWGDADCSDIIDPIDSLKILRFDAGLFYIQQEPCPDIGAEVHIPQQ